MKDYSRLSLLSLALLVLISLSSCYGQTKKYEPNWDSLDSRPLPQWYDQSKIGIFIHWGVFSVPSFGSEWFWWYWKGSKDPKYVNYVSKNFKPGTTYADFAPQFTAELYDPKKWADLFLNSGAKYVVLTSKHHEGFTLWPSKTSWNWNAMDVGPKRDLVGDLAAAVRSNGLRFGLYHSLFEWFNPIFLDDQKSGSQHFVDMKAMPELFDLVETYQPDIIWSDGDVGDDKYWRSKEFLAWLYNDSPVKGAVVVNDRWGTGTGCKHGGFMSCSDRFNPGTLQPRKWENAMTLDKNSWSYSRISELKDYLSIGELLETLVHTVSFGGNLLVNVGPTSDGRIIPIMEERLLQMGNWLKVNGEAIYKTNPWKHQNDTLTPKVWYTQAASAASTTTVYATFFNWPKNEVLTLGSIQNAAEKAEVYLLTQSGPQMLTWESSLTGDMAINLVSTSTLWAWTLKICNL